MLALPEVSALVLWQLSDATSWMADPGLKNGLRKDKKPSRPLPYDRVFKKKPAWYAIADALKAMPERRPIKAK